MGIVARVKQNSLIARRRVIGPQHIPPILGLDIGQHGAVRAPAKAQRSRTHQCPGATRSRAVMGGYVAAPSLWEAPQSAQEPRSAYCTLPATARARRVSSPRLSGSSQFGLRLPLDSTVHVHGVVVAPGRQRMPGWRAQVCHACSPSPFLSRRRGVILPTSAAAAANSKPTLSAAATCKPAPLEKPSQSIRSISPGRQVLSKKGSSGP